MEIKCIACQATNNLNGNHIDVNGLMVRCHLCRYIFMVYPPDIYGLPITQDTKIDQSILDDLIKIQDDTGTEDPFNAIPPERRDPMIERISTDNRGEENSNPKPDTDDFEYADLPDLSEFEKMIDWDDINDLDDLPAKPDQEHTDTRDLDVKGA